MFYWKLFCFPVKCNLGFMPCTQLPLPPPNWYAFEGLLSDRDGNEVIFAYCHKQSLPSSIHLGTHHFHPSFAYCLLLFLFIKHQTPKDFGLSQSAYFQLSYKNTFIFFWQSASSLLWKTCWRPNLRLSIKAMIGMNSFSHPILMFINLKGLVCFLRTIQYCPCFYFLVE